MSKRILIVTNHRKNRSPGQRFRFEQYIDYLRTKDIHFDWDALLNEKEDGIFFSNNTVSKVLLVLKIFIKRLRTLNKVKNYDAVLIHREAFVIRGAFFEKWIAKRNPNIVFDFDDAIWIQNVSKVNEKFRWLKKSDKTKEIIKLSKHVITGNSYLGDYAKQYNSTIAVIPTTIDTNYHIPTSAKTGNDSVITIGWTGSSTTLPYFEQIIPELELLKKKYGDKVAFKIIVDIEKYFPSIQTKTTSWSLKSEIADLNRIDIGLMPLPETEWSKGKCGFKALQYMSLEIPTIVSNVGVNKEIVQDGTNGFKVYKNEWVEKIALLIENPDLRKKMGEEARKTIQNKYSVEANKKNYLDVFENI